MNLILLRSKRRRYDMQSFVGGAATLIILIVWAIIWDESSSFLGKSGW